MTGATIAGGALSRPYLGFPVKLRLNRLPDCAALRNHRVRLGERAPGCS